MYSLVLMMALSDGATLPSALPNQATIAKRAGTQELNRGRHGCRGGCYGGCRGGCYGGYGGCYGGCYGGYGGCYGCYGGGYMSGYYGGMAAPAGYQSSYPPAGAPAGAPGGYQSSYGPANQPTQAAPAQIVVDLPADARLTFDGTQTQQTSAQRVFTTPALEPGYNYYYTLTATAVRNGQPVTTTKRVPVTAGTSSRVQLNFNDSEVAQR